MSLYADQWKDKTLTDLVIRVIVRPPTDGRPSAKRARTHIVDHAVHAVIVAQHSAYVKTRVYGAAAEAAYPMAYASDVTMPGCRRHVLLDVQVEEDADLETMEAVLRYCYTGRLTETKSTHLDDLLRVLKLADQLLMPGCASRAMTELAGRGPNDYDPRVAVDVYTGVHDAWLDGPTGTAAERAAVKHAAGERVKVHVIQCQHDPVVREQLTSPLLLGDTDAVHQALMRADAERTPHERLQRDVWLQLVPSTVVALLRSDRLQARSENAVLMMALHWLAEGRDEEEEGMVLDEVRLSQLTPTALHLLLPENYPSQEDAATLQLFNAAEPDMREDMLTCETVMGAPSAWYTPTGRAPLTRPLAMELGLTAAELSSKLTAPPGDRKTYTLLAKSRPYAFNGFTLSLVAEVEPGEVFVGVIVRLGNERDETVDHLAARISVTLMAMTSVTSHVRDSLQADSMFGVRTSMQDPWDPAEWQEYLVDGGLSVTATVTECT